MVPSPFGAYSGAIAPLPDGQVLVLYMTAEEPGYWSTVSRSIAAPFGEWPPASLSPAVEHVDLVFFHRTLVTRADGAFIARTNLDVWGAVHGLPGAFYESASFTPIRRAYLEPNGPGYYQTEADELRFYAALTDSEPSATAALPTNWPGEAGPDAEGRLVLNAAGWLYLVEGATLTPYAEAPLDLNYEAIVPRAGGGVWLVGKRIQGAPAYGTVEVWAIDEARSELSKPLGDLTVLDVGFGPWGEGGGVVLAAGDEDGGYRVAITDGAYVTKVEVSHEATGLLQNGISVVSSPDGASILVGYLRSPDPTELGLAIQRFDCVSP